MWFLFVKKKRKKIFKNESISPYDVEGLYDNKFVLFLRKKYANIISRSFQKEIFMKILYRFKKNHKFR